MLRFFGRLFFSIVVVVASNVAIAAGPIAVSDTGVASAWDNSVPISYHPESGTCATYSNTDIVAMLESVLDYWTNLDEVDLSFSQVTGSISQVGVDNYGDYLYLGEEGTEGNATDGINPVLFDDDGEIIAEVAGNENQYVVLGFAGADGFNDDASVIDDGQAVFNCRCLVNHPSGPCYYDGQTVLEFSEIDFQYTMLHEMGHFLNLEHSQVGIDKYVLDGSIENLPIMFPIVVEGIEDLEPRFDDIASIAALYPSDTFLAADTAGTPWCEITGTLLDVDGNPLMCADVWAIGGGGYETTSRTTSATTGNWAYGTDANEDGDLVDDGECEGQCGYFEMHIQADTITTFVVQPVQEIFVEGSSVGPCANGQNSGVEAEILFEIDGSLCGPGGALDFGDIATLSTDGLSSGTDTETDTGGGGGGSSTDGASYDDLNPVGYWCALSPNAATSSVSGLICFAAVVAVILASRFYQRIRICKIL